VARTFYRVVRTNPPTLTDFTSNQALGKPLIDPTPERRRLWNGLSVYATRAQARRTARRFPGLGQYIVALVIPEAGPIRVERTTAQPGHHTLWGFPHQIAECVVAVAPVE
jgi:hypothetical protein